MKIPRHPMPALRDASGWKEFVEARFGTACSDGWLRHCEPEGFRALSLIFSLSNHASCLGAPYMRVLELLFERNNTLGPSGLSNNQTISIITSSTQ